MAVLSLASLQTESRNPKTAQIDMLESRDICRLINEEDATIAKAVEACLTDIADAVTQIAFRVKKGGRVVYVGAGTSGRLGILDASEIPPTFSAPPEQFVAFIAGGNLAIRTAVEGAEDNGPMGVRDLKSLSPPINPELDTVIGIAASGRTPYVLACLSYARSIGCFTVGISCVDPTEMRSVAECIISPVTGPEVVTGSTRLKAGTATKMVLNMISTGVMIKIGKTYGNMMVDVKASNVKLKQRAVNIIREIIPETKIMQDGELDEMINDSEGSVKLAILRLKSGMGNADCQSKLEEAGGSLSAALMALEASKSLKTVDGLSHHHDDTPRFPFVRSSKVEIKEHSDISIIQEGLVICVDAGGSKCCVAISDSTGNISSVDAGPCNYTSIGLQKTIEIISEATKLALHKIAKTKDSKNLSSIQKELEEKSIQTPFSAIRIGIAGIDRPGAREQLIPALSHAFNIPEGSKILTVTNDADLLTSIIRAKHSTATEAVVLIAGTGSIAISYVLDSETGQMTQTRRAGGWGSILGDDGSGFDIGRQGIRSTLRALENYKCDRSGGKMEGNFGRLEKKILEHFGASEEDYDLLSKVLEVTGAVDNDIRRRIARVGKIVLDMMDSDFTAGKIVERAIEELVRMVRCVLPCQESVVHGTALVLSGGLMKSPAFKSKILDRLRDGGLHFEICECILEPALEAVRLLRISRN